MNDILLFSSETCPNCDQIKGFFEKENIEYKEILKEAEEELLMDAAREAGIRALPFAKIKGEYVTFKNIKEKSLKMRN